MSFEMSKTSRAGLRRRGRERLKLISNQEKRQFNNENTAEQKGTMRVKKHLLHWIKDNCCCKSCGARPQRSELTFHHVAEKREGRPVLSQFTNGTWTQLVKELLKGHFLCKDCHRAEHIPKEN